MAALPSMIPEAVGKSEDDIIGSVFRVLPSCFEVVNPSNPARYRIDGELTR